MWSSRCALILWGWSPIRQLAEMWRNVKLHMSDNYVYFQFESYIYLFCGARNYDIICSISDVNTSTDKMVQSQSETTLLQWWFLLIFEWDKHECISRDSPRSFGIVAQRSEYQCWDVRISKCVSSSRTNFTFSSRLYIFAIHIHTLMHDFILVALCASFIATAEIHLCVFQA